MFNIGLQLGVPQTENITRAMRKDRGEVVNEIVRVVL